MRKDSVNFLYGIGMFKHVFFYLIIFALSNGSPSAHAGLSKECLLGLEAVSRFGNGWITKSLVANKILEQGLGQEIVFSHTYECKNCGQESSMKPNTHEGRTVCKSCGKPHSGEDTFQKTINGTPVVHIDDFLLGEANLPKLRELNWKCSSCGGVIPAAKKACPGCAAPRTTGSAVYIHQGPATEIRGPEFNSLPMVPSMQRDRIAEYTNPAGREKRPVRAAKDDTPQAQKKEWSKEQKWFAGITGTLALGALGKYLFSTHDYDGSAVSMQWEKTIEIEEYRVVTKENWCDSLTKKSPRMPVNGVGEEAGLFNIQQNGQREHHTVKVFDHTENYEVQESYQETYNDTEEVDLGNGNSVIRTVEKQRTATRPVTKQRDVYRDDPVYQNWCTYETYEWKHQRTERSFGGAPESSRGLAEEVPVSLPLPRFQLSKHERSLAPKSKYEIFFTYDHKGKTKNYTDTPEQEADFLKWRPGDKAVIVRRNLGSIAEVKKPGE